MTDPLIDDVRRYLSELPELCSLLPLAMATRSAGVQTSRPTPSSRPPVRLDVLHLMDQNPKDILGGQYIGHRYPDPDRTGVLPYLWSWVRDIESEAMDMRPELPEELPEHPTVSNVCAWLLGELEWAATLPQWEEMAMGIRSTWQAVKAAVASVEDKPERPVPCERCRGALRQMEGTEQRWECWQCGHIVTVQAVTLSEAARILRHDLGKKAPTLRTLQRWALRPGILAPIADGPRRRIFDLGQIRRLAAEARLREGA